MYLYGVEARGCIYMVQRPEGVFIWRRGQIVYLCGIEYRGCIYKVLRPESVFTWCIWKDGAFIRC